MEREEFETQIAAAQDDVAELLRLSYLLGGRPEAWARKLRLDAIAQRVRLHKVEVPAGSDAVAQSPAPPDWLAALGIEAPDGRPLYRYRLGREQYAATQDELERRAPAMLWRRNMSDCALFVLWAAEWYRRSYRGGVQKWQIWEMRSAWRSITRHGDGSPMPV